MKHWPIILVVILTICLAIFADQKSLDTVEPTPTPFELLTSLEASVASLDSTELEMLGLQAAGVMTALGWTVAKRDEEIVDWHMGPATERSFGTWPAGADSVEIRTSVRIPVEIDGHLQISANWRSLVDARAGVTRTFLAPVVNGEVEGGFGRIVDYHTGEIDGFHYGEPDTNYWWIPER